MITDIHDYFAKGCDRCARFDSPDCSAMIWQSGLHALRDILTTTGCAETVKWGHPCYTHAGRNIAIIGAFRGDFRLTFFHAGLMKDPDAVLQKQGPNTATADMMRFTSGDQVTAQAAIIRSYMAEAMGYAERVIKAPKPDNQPDMPEELSEALDRDPELAEAFHALTPGRQKSYLINLNGAKQSATRTARIVKFRNKIIAGKAATDR